MSDNLTEKQKKAIAEAIEQGRIPLAESMQRVYPRLNEMEKKQAEEQQDK